MAKVSELWSRTRASLASWSARFAWYDAVILVSVLSVGLMRFLVLRSGGAPPTIDSGNWLAFADLWLGNPTRSTGIVYPPVVPLLARGFVATLGAINGISLLAAISSVAPAVGMYAGLRYLGLGVGSLAPALLILGPSAIGEATAWGGFPQLLGLGLTPIVLIAVDKWLRSWTRRDAVVAGVTMMVLLATSHFIGATVALTVAVMAVMSLMSPVGSARTWRHEVLSMGLVVLPALWLIPIYLVIGEAMGGASREFQSFDRLTWSNLREHIEFLYRDFPWVWRTVLSATVVTPLLLVKHHRTTLWRLTAGLLIAVLAATLLTREGRFLYFLTILGAFTVALWMDRVLSRSWDRPEGARSVSGTQVANAITAVAIVVVGWQIGSGMRFFEDQREFYGILSPGIVSAIEYVDDNIEPGGVVAVTSLRDGPLGWWVEALTQESVLYGSPLRWLAFGDEIERATLANAIFTPPFPTDEKLELARTAGVDFIIVPTRWAFYDSEAINELAMASPEMLVLRNDGAVVLKP